MANRDARTGGGGVVKRQVGFPKIDTSTSHSHCLLIGQIQREAIIIRFGTSLNLLTETHIGTPVGLKKPFTLYFTITISIGIAELKFQKGGCLRSNRCQKVVKNFLG